MLLAGQKKTKTTQQQDNVEENENKCSDRVINNDNADLTDKENEAEFEVELEQLTVVNVEDVPAQKPHFLDYDAIEPPLEDLEERFAKVLSLDTESAKSDSTTNELIKLDKKFERDGEISDYELAASGYTKKEFTQDDNTLHLASGFGASEHATLRKSLFSKPKHFLDENPIPPDYMLESEMREHRSLDRNFERQGGEQQRTDNTSTSSASSIRTGRKSSLDRGGGGSDPQTRSSRERIKTSTPSYALTRFLSSPSTPFPPQLPQPTQRSNVPKGGAWTGEHFGSSHYDNLRTSLGPTDLEIENMGPKVECVYSLLSMLGSNDPLDMSKKFLELSRTVETCATLRRSGCIPLLVQMMHSVDAEVSVRNCASMALHNVVHSNPDEKAGRREAKVLRLLDQITNYCNFLKTLLQSGGEAIADDTDRHPLAAISSLMKVSFDEEHRHAMCELGALHSIPNLVHLDHAAHGPRPEIICQENASDEAGKNGLTQGQGCNSLRRYALMALTNLTFGDENNKAQLCSQKPFMEALVAQLDSAPDDLLQVTASVLRNLSWRADKNMKSVLNEIGTVTALARAAMKNKNENTLKAILSALWNLSAHCSTNKAEFCAVDGALAFLVDMLTYEGPSKTLKIIENAGGILRNVSSHIAVRENYRKILRERNCLAILLQQLKSESLTVVSNSCGTLWNLSARCPEDQKFLWDNGAVPMLRSLIHSKHAMISEGSSSALKNLLNFRPSGHNQLKLDPIARSMGLKKLPTLNARKQRALEQELGAKVHAETCENLDSNGGLVENVLKNSTEHIGIDGLLARRLAVPPTSNSNATMRLTRSAMLTKSESRDSILSAKSDTVYEHLLRSHSASDAGRSQKRAPKIGPYSNIQRSVYTFKQEDEPNEDHEQPFDYSRKYNENSNRKTSKKSVLSGENDEGDMARNANVFSTYQETDLDQPTDFSLRYAENQAESDVELTAPHAETKPETANKTANNEILLILEDTVKCYQTEDTPYVISNAASITDLRQSIKTDCTTTTTTTTTVECENKAVSVAMTTTVKTKEIAIKNTAAERITVVPSAQSYASGSNTPEKPINYCEEGTPGYFSRYDSLSSLDEPIASSNTDNVDAIKTSNVSNNRNACKSHIDAADDIAQKQQSVSPKRNNDSTCSPSLNPVVTANTRMPAVTPNINSAQETPLMFSRRSSMDSLIAEDDEVVQCDDKSSVVSDFSRLASGIISPSEIPDSPTQSMPQSPRRNSESFSHQQKYNDSISCSTPRGGGGNGPLRSVFEDGVNMFHVENTPAQFSSATSLSNLSIVDDLTSSPENAIDQQIANNTIDKEHHQHNIVSEGEEELAGNNDDILLANCINIGMQRATCNTSKHKSSSKFNVNQMQQIPFDETTKQYCTEDTPALLSKVGSNSNLSAISICSSNNNPFKQEQLMEESTLKCEQRNSLNLSDDVSSNASECGAATGQSFDILQQCIQDGMKKKQTTSLAKSKAAAADIELPMQNDPIAMMRRGGNALPRYLPVADEMGKYLVEDSPCNFSVMSGLSNLTVGSSLVGPAIQLKENEEKLPVQHVKRRTPDANMRTGRGDQWRDDSLSSLSIESEDDANLLSQAIAAGCNRPKSNLDFSSTTTTSVNSKRSTSLSASQPIPINQGHFLKQHSTNKNQSNSGNSNIVNGNESFSSVDSSDSNDNQSKSLLELCILTGMHKTRDATHGNSSRSRPYHNHHNRTGLNANVNHAATQSNPNLKQFDSLPLQLNAQSSRVKPHLSSSSSSSSNRHQRKRESKDEKLLLECINTGITRKINNGAVKSLTNQLQNLNFENRLHGMVGSECVLNNCVQPKNVEATSAAVPVVAELQLNNVNAININTNASANTTAIAASDVEKKKNENVYQQQQQQQHTNKNFEQAKSMKHNGIQDDIIDGNVNQVKHHQEDAVSDVGDHQNIEMQYKKMNVIGFNTRSNSNLNNSLENANSDDSNESFIIETTVSLLEQPTTQGQSITASTIVEKHKDPELMLRSVERLTLEFVSSAEQLRTHASTDNPTHVGKRNNSFSIGDGSSNNTWNENTHPNDVSFPSVSVSAPVLDPMTFDDDDEEADEELATEADHKELHDFTEITPTNEEHPQCSLLGMTEDEIDMYAASVTPQLNSLETETVINEEASLQLLSGMQLNAESRINSINFRLGGAVQTAAVSYLDQTSSRTHSSHHTFSNSMTNSTLIANEARALAENLCMQNNGEDNDYAFSLHSLDLDNIRPPSAMESLNASGYFYSHDQYTHASTTQPNSLHKFAPHSPQIGAKSPKFPLKSLPAGLVARRALGQFTGSAESVNSSFNLLDNIKPPSLMDELLDSMISVSSIQSEIVDNCESMATTISISNYETANGNDEINRKVDSNHLNNDFDDNTVTLHSCCEMLPCDDDIKNDDDDEDEENSGTPLPTDENFSSAESTPRKSLLDSPESKQKISLTPKMKRKLAKDRFKTYTITTTVRDENSLEREANNCEMVEEMLQVEVIETSPNNQRNSVNRRRTSQERYKTQTIIFPSTAAQIVADCDEQPNSLTSTDDCLSDDMSSIRAMTTKFTHITESLKIETQTATLPSDEQQLYSTEFDQNSETESCHDESVYANEEKPNDIRSGPIIRNSIEQILTTIESVEEQPLQLQQIKVVRGQKKAAYVSPYSKQYQRSNTAPVSRIATNKSTTIAVNSNATFLRKRSTNASTPCVNTKVGTKNKTVVDQVAESPTPVLARQGTFVKDEPTLTQAEMPVVEPIAPITVQTTPSPKRTVSKLPTKRIASADTISPKHSSVAKVVAASRKVPISATTKPQRSNSNTNMRTHNTASVAAAVRIARVSTTTPPSRSNSNLNSNESGSNVANKINQAQSRIAGIWKRVNDAKINASNVKSTTAPTTTTNKKASHTKSASSINTQTPQQLTRSSTFDSSDQQQLPTNAIATTAVTTKTQTQKETRIIALKAKTAREISKNGKVGVVARIGTRKALK